MGSVRLMTEIFYSTYLQSFQAGFVCFIIFDEFYGGQYLARTFVIKQKTCQDTLQEPIERDGKQTTNDKIAVTLKRSLYTKSSFPPK